MLWKTTVTSSLLELAETFAGQSTEDVPTRRATGSAVEDVPTHAEDSFNEENAEAISEEKLCLLVLGFFYGTATLFYFF